MTRIKLTILFVLAIQLAHGQIDFDLIKFRGLGFSLTKETVIKSFGQPKIIHTNYECGFYDNSQPGGPYYQLAFSNFNYIGSDKEPFILQTVTFDHSGKTKLQYGNKELSGLTRKSVFIEIFGEVAKKHFKENPDDDLILLRSTYGDDGAMFIFKDGRLIKYEYWSPC